MGRDSQGLVDLEDVKSLADHLSVNGWSAGPLYAVIAEVRSLRAEKAEREAQVGDIKNTLIFDGGRVIGVIHHAGDPIRIDIFKRDGDGHSRYAAPEPSASTDAPPAPDDADQFVPGDGVAQIVQQIIDLAADSDGNDRIARVLVAAKAGEILGLLRGGPA